jgi:hypothetical protein
MTLSNKYFERITITETLIEFDNYKFGEDQIMDAEKSAQELAEALGREYVINY